MKWLKVLCMMENPLYQANSEHLYANFLQISFRIQQVESVMEYLWGSLMRTRNTLHVSMSHQRTTMETVQQHIHVDYTESHSRCFSLLPFTFQLVHRVHGNLSGGFSLQDFPSLSLKWQLSPTCSPSSWTVFTILSLRVSHNSIKRVQERCSGL